MQDQFFKDVIHGLSSTPKKLSSKYFYDDKGSDIFREIMEMDSYYLTNAETEIFKERSGEIVDVLQFEKQFRLVELGAGDGTKTSYLLDTLLKRDIDFIYSPIDISAHANEILSEILKKRFPTLNLSPQNGDYFSILENFKNNQEPLLILFIGSNIGNYLEQDALSLLRLIRNVMRPGDKLLIGVDLKKNPLVVREAYFDKEGITRRFNLNLLTRINRELDGNFDLDQFEFYASYDPISGEVRSYIFSLIDQTVKIGTEHEFHFLAGEPVWTELSKKYDIQELEGLLTQIDLRPVGHFTDPQNYFTDSLFER